MRRLLTINMALSTTINTITLSSNQTHIHTNPNPLLRSSFSFSFFSNMENPNPSPSKDSTNKSPSSSPQRIPSDHDDSPPPTNPPNEGSERGRNEGAIILKTPLEVLAELTAGDDEIGGYDGAQGGGSMALVVAVGGSMVVEGGGVGGSEGHALRKRKNTQVKDPPTGKPTCPECKREFSTWKAAFGHMRKHPNRPHRGFYPPPVFSSSSATTNPPESGHNEGAAFDLNMEVAGSSDAAERNPAPDTEENANNEGKNLGFDLNLPPTAEEDDDE